MGWCGWRRKISRDTCSSSVLSEVAKSPRRVDMASLSALVVDDSAVPASAASIIVDMLGDVFGMTSPKPFQVTTIYLLAFIFSTVLLIQKTGAGKSLVILGAAALLGGVIVVIEPLVAVGADQARSVSEKTLWIKSFHVAGIDEKSKRRLAKYLTAMLSRERRPVILFLSADDVKPGSRWAMPLKQLFERGLVSLVAFDEIQKILADGRYFREELGMLEENVIRLIGLSPCRVSQLHMTATIEKLALSSYKSMMGGLHFEYTIHGDVSRRDIHLFVGINTQPTQAAKAVVKKHLREPHRKVIVYTNSLKCASGPLLKAFRALIASSPDLSGDVMSITGKSGVILKTYVAERFSSSEASHSLDQRVVTGTSSFGCGVSSPYCGARHARHDRGFGRVRYDIQVSELKQGFTQAPCAICIAHRTEVFFLKNAHSPRNSNKTRAKGTYHLLLRLSNGTSYRPQHILTKVQLQSPRSSPGSCCMKKTK